MEQGLTIHSQGGLQPSVPAIGYRDRTGHIPTTVEYRTKGTSIAAIVPGSEEQRAFLNIIDDLPGYMGVREPLTEDEILVCTAFIRDHFGHLNAQEVVRAFALAAAGKLLAPIEVSQEGASAAQLQAAKDGQLVTVRAETFNKWSLPYVGRVLKAYSDMRQRETLEWERRTASERKQIDTPAAPEYEPMEVLDHLRGHIERTGEILAYCDWARAYRALCETGEIAMTEATKADYAKAVRESETNEALLSNRRRSLLAHLARPESLKNECRKRLVITWAIAAYPGAKYPLPITLPDVVLKPQPKTSKTRKK